MTVFPCATLPVCVCCERLAECECFMCVSPFKHGGLAHYEVIRDAKLEADRSAGATQTHILVHSEGQTVSVYCSLSE